MYIHWVFCPHPGHYGVYISHVRVQLLPAIISDVKLTPHEAKPQLEVASEGVGS